MKKVVIEELLFEYCSPVEELVYFNEEPALYFVEKVSNIIAFVLML